MGTRKEGKDQKEEQERKTYLFGIVAGACLYVCRLSLFNFEKHARAGNNIAKNESETQKAIISLSSSLFISSELEARCPSSKPKTHSSSPNLIHLPPVLHPFLSYVLAF
jgi:hypothetical protein